MCLCSVQLRSILQILVTSYSLSAPKFGVWKTACWLPFCCWLLVHFAPWERGKATSAHFLGPGCDTDKNQNLEYHLESTLGHFWEFKRTHYAKTTHWSPCQNCQSTFYVLPLITQTLIFHVITRWVVPCKRATGSSEGQHWKIQTPKEIWWT